MAEIFPESPEAVCHGCGMFFPGDELVGDGTDSYCIKCWDRLADMEARTEVYPEPEADPDFELAESAKPSALKELKRLLFDVLETKYGIVRFAYVRRNGRLRHARAKHRKYEHKTDQKRAKDIITYFDANRLGFRCFHEDQMVDAWPKWGRR